MLRVVIVGHEIVVEVRLEHLRLLDFGIQSPFRRAVRKFLLHAPNNAVPILHELSKLIITRVPEILQMRDIEELV